MRNNTAEARICDRCNNFYVSPDGTRATCSALDIKCDYFALRFSGQVNSCHFFKQLTKEKGADNEKR